MRIIDRLASGPVAQAHWDISGTLHSVDISDEVRRMISDCNLRFVVDRDASRQCANLMRVQPEIFELEESVLRFPAERCWIEFFEDSEPDERMMFRHGILAETDRTGRAGSLRIFLEYANGGVTMVPATLEFDLDSGIATDGNETFRIRSAALPGLDGIFDCVAFRPDRYWLEHCHRPGDRAHFLQSQCNGAWYALPYALCFVALLNSRSVLNERRSDLERLNRARVRRGRTPLLDHVEVSLQLGARFGATQQAGAGSGRKTPRLHIVRGHTVQRAGKSFWRATHIRGDGEQISYSRTVSVKSAQS